MRGVERPVRDQMFLFTSRMRCAMRGAERMYMSRGDFGFGKVQGHHHHRTSGGNIMDIDFI